MPSFVEASEDGSGEDLGTKVKDVVGGFAGQIDPDFSVILERIGQEQWKKPQ